MPDWLLTVNRLPLTYEPGSPLESQFPADVERGQLEKSDEGLVGPDAPVPELRNEAFQVSIKNT